ncbi:MAG: hypothetical protein GY722_26955 [bacterium]|nr:hypothetical protein [bacterium]
MDDTHEEKTEHDMTESHDDGDAVEKLAAMDPADAPGAAERYALELAKDLEDAGAAAPDPVQLSADLGDRPDA